MDKKEVEGISDDKEGGMGYVWRTSGHLVWLKHRVSEGHEGIQGHERGLPLCCLEEQAMRKRL